MSDVALLSPPEADDWPPPQPAGLNKSGRVLWDRVTAEWELDPREVVILEQACRQADDIARIDRALKRDGLKVVGSQGQPRMNPMLTEVRNARLALKTLLGELDLPTDDGGPGGGTAQSRQTSAAASTRWNRLAAERAAAQREAEIS